MAFLEVKSLKKIYTTRFSGNQVQALSNVNFSVEQGEYVAIMGESGSGKTTLLNILAALDRPTSGQIFLNGKDLGGIREKELAAFRREHLGFVFQECDFYSISRFFEDKSREIAVPCPGCETAEIWMPNLSAACLLKYWAVKPMISFLRNMHWMN